VCSPGPIAPPSSPTVPLANSPTASTVQVSWAVPEDLGGASASNMRYTVVVGRTMSQDEPEVLPGGTILRGWVGARVEGSVALIRDLSHSTSYRFVVVAENSAGTGGVSVRTSPVRTGPASIPGPPGKPAALRVTGGGVLLGWDPPIETGGGVLVS